MCKRINIFFACFLAFYVAGSMAAGLVIGTTGIDLPYWGQCLISQAILLIPAFIYVFINKINIYKCIPYRKIKQLDAFLSLVFGYTLIPVVLFINVLTQFISTNYMNDAVSDLTSYPFIIQIILLAVIPPVVEEFIFRGLIYHSYRKNGICGAALLSGLLFGVTHLNINQLCYAFVIGVMFAFLVEVTGSMWSSMIAHFAVNTYSITVMKILSLAGVDVNAMAGQTQQLSSGSMFIATIIQVIVLGTIAMGFLALSILILKKLAERNGKAGFIRRDFELRHVRRNGEKFVTIPLIITLVLAFGYMIFTEIITRLTMMV